MMENRKPATSGINTAKTVRAIGALFLTIIIVCVLIISRKLDHTPLAWWEYIDVLFLFLAAFCRLCSLMYGARLKVLSRRFNILALIFLILALVAFLFVWFATM